MSFEQEGGIFITVLPICSPEFRPYGRTLEGYDFMEFIHALKQTPYPEDGVIYQPSETSLETLLTSQELKMRFYGGMPIQIGYCNGHNGSLNCLEYHRDSEVNVFAADAVLMVALEWEIENGKLDTSRVKAFRVPAGTAVELFATTLHYAPCSPDANSRFQVSIVLPRGTNTEKPDIVPKSAEDKMLWAKNKWLLAHPDSPEAQAGAYVGLSGENLKLF